MSLRRREPVISTQSSVQMLDLDTSSAIVEINQVFKKFTDEFLKGLQAVPLSDVNFEFKIPKELVWGHRDALTAYQFDFEKYLKETKMTEKEADEKLMEFCYNIKQQLPNITFRSGSSGLAYYFFLHMSHRIIEVEAEIRLVLGQGGKLIIMTPIRFLTDSVRKEDSQKRRAA